MPTGAICITPDVNNPGGGTFEANIYTQSATFDVAINTVAVFGNALLGTFPFPFVLQSNVPFGLSEMLGLLTGSSDLTITQPIEQALNFTVPIGPGIPVTGTLTGEITLAGRVLPVGGIKEKVLAAHRLGIKEVILPQRNEKAVKEDIPENVRNDLKIHLVSTIEQVLHLALTARGVQPAKILEVVQQTVVPQQFTN